MMNDMDHPPRRDANGRFLPGQCGNPAGKKPGTRNGATLLREALNDGEDRAVARIVIDKALAGNAVAARFLVGRLMPPPRGRAIELDLPNGTGAADILAASNATVAAMAAGEITPEEALTVTRVLDGRLRALQAAMREESRNSARAQQSPSALAPGVASPQGADAEPGAQSNQPPHSPIAAAIGPSLSLNGRGEDANFRARLLHSTCILQQSAPAAAATGGWAPSPSLTGALAAA